MSFWSYLLEKFNPAQPEIVQNEGDEKDSTALSKYTISTAYQNIDIVNRGINLLVDSAAELDFDVQKKIPDLGVAVTNTKIPINKPRLTKLLNYKPNPYQNVDAFRRNILMDYIIEGNMFIHFDGAFLYHVPAADMIIHTDKKTFINKYEYNNQPFKADSIIHIKENSVNSIFRGDSRLNSALPAMSVLDNMQGFNDNYFQNNAIPGLILQTPNTLSRKVKDRILADWAQRFNPKSGGKRPAILDGDFKVTNLGHTDLRELDFKESTKTQEKKILVALGIPPILLDSGNNANISPNLRMFYILTVIPMVNRLVKALEFYFGFDIDIIKDGIIALRPELKEESAYHVGLVNSGIITINESRDALRLKKSKEEHADMLRVPQNIAGSALHPEQGGKPVEDTE